MAPLLLGPPEIHLSLPVAIANTKTTGDEFMDLLTANFNATTLSGKPPMCLTENHSPTYLSTGNPCLDFFFHVVPDTPSERLTYLLETAWKQDSLTALKLVCHLRGVRGTGKSDKEGFYSAALWLHKNHPKTLACNVRCFSDFGYVKDLPEILFRLLEGLEVRKIAKEQRELKRSSKKRRWKRKQKRRVFEKAREERVAAEAARVKSEKEKARNQRKMKIADMAKKALERYNRDPDYRFLHDRISELFADLLISDLDTINSGDSKHLSLASKWCPSLDSSFDRSTLLCESIAKRIFPREKHPEYAEIEEQHYAYRVRDRLRKEKMSSTPAPPSKEWMKEGRHTHEYIQGVNSFIEFVRANADKLGTTDWYCCPCKNCRNVVKERKTLAVIKEHLICDGIYQEYTTWFHHGENFPDRRIDVAASAHVNNCIDDSFPGIVNMVNNTFGRVFDNEDVGASIPACMDEENGEDFVQVEDELYENLHYKKLMEDAIQPLYPSCRIEDTKLSVMIELLSMKARHQWSDKSFTELLKLIKKILPKENTLPETTYTAKKMIKSLRMKCEIIHACRNDCILYWREHEEHDQCPTCGESRWRPVNVSKPNNKRIPWKKLRYFPLTPRLQRMYSIPWIAKNMTWHAKAGSVPNEEIMRHPMDSSCWKRVDSTWGDFAAEERNVRLGLATDGFNPFGNKNNSYSCWPVMIVPYNLPPSLCMRKEFTMLTLLIPGKNGPGHDIDVYLQPLIAELNELWSIGFVTYDSYTRNRFTMKAILLWTIHDFPAYAHLSGCRTAGKYGCPVCGEGTESVWLTHGKKFAYMGHRKFLRMSDPCRKKKSQFNGKEELRSSSRRLTGSELLRRLESIETKFGKEPTSQKRKRCENDDTPWSKRSCFFDLPYWEKLPIRNNLDVMHIEKNVAETFFATIMNIKGKTKDGLAARQDLKDMGFTGRWKKLWLEERNGKITYPPAPYTLSPAEKKLICETLYHLKVPIGYSSNWKHNVNLKDREFKNLKSHDYHILMQQLLPVLLMHTFKNQDQKPLRAAIRNLSIFFNVLCSKVINRAELLKMKENIVETLCVFETYFPPSFFVSMIHLVVHLVEEAQICGPVRYRWMYPFERMMKTYKRYVVNQTYPEGCITECYLMDEAMTYSMNYISDGSIRSHKRGCGTFMEDDDECGYPIDKKGKDYRLDNVKYQQARKWVLSQYAGNAEWEKKYETYCQRPVSTTQNQRSNMRRNPTMEYIPWLKHQLETEEDSILKRLVEGPNFIAKSYNAYAVNGYVFHTAESERNTMTQNSGVSMKALTTRVSGPRDTNPVVEDVIYYGIIQQILELNYHDLKEIVFYCDWVRIDDVINGCIVDPNVNLRTVNLGRLQRKTKEEDEPFILASQATQVFYCKDHSKPVDDKWHIVLDAPKRLNQDVDVYDDPLVFEARMNELILPIEDDIMEDNEY